MGPQLIRHGQQILSTFIMLVLTGQFIINNCMDVQKSRMYRQLPFLLLFDKPYFVHERESWKVTTNS